MVKSWGRISAAGRLGRVFGVLALAAGLWAFAGPRGQRDV
jgi:hypothetical protein